MYAYCTVHKYNAASYTSYKFNIIPCRYECQSLILLLQSIGKNTQARKLEAPMHCFLYTLVLNVDMAPLIHLKVQYEFHDQFFFSFDGI